MANVVVYKNRTNVVIVELGVDVSDDTFVSEIREGRDSDSTLIATWEIEFLSDGVDGKLLFTLDNSVTELITQKTGYMDIKRTTNLEPIAVFDKTVRVEFRETVTA